MAMACRVPRPHYRCSSNSWVFAAGFALRAHCLKPLGAIMDPAGRQHRQFAQLVSYTQRQIQTSVARRVEFWSKADSSSPERWNQTTRFYRDYIWGEVIGRLPPPSLPANPRTRLIYDEPKFRGYEVRAQAR